jgi:hypothetical protein
MNNTSNVTQLAPRVDGASPDQAELLLQAIDQIVPLTRHLLAFERRVENLIRENEDLRRENIELRVRIGLVESKRPSPRFEAPKGWITIREAVSLSGAGRSTVSRLVAQEKIVGAGYGGRVFVDPDSLQRWIERK